MKNKRIFISGGSGVIGRDLIRKLISKGAKIMTGDLVSLPKDLRKKVIFRKGDLNYIKKKYISNFRPEIFIHLAAKFERVEESKKHWENNYWHNVRLSHYLMGLMKELSSVKKIINASSYLIYDKKLYTSKSKKKPYKLKEEDPLDPRNLTGGAKLFNEVELEYLNKIKSKKLIFVSARIFRGYGKGSRDIISRWVKDALKNKTLKVYNDKNSFDYINSHDTSLGLISLCKVSKSGIFNLASGKSTKISSIIKILKENFPKLKIKYQRSNELIENSEANLRKIKLYVNWKPKVSIKEGIKEIIIYEKNKK